MSSIISQDIRSKGAGETRDFAVSYVDKLKKLGTDPETYQALTGTPAVMAYEVTGYPATKTPKSGLTITSVQRNASVLVINDKSVAVDNAVAFTVAGGTAGESYMLEALANTASETALAVGCRLNVE